MICNEMPFGTAGWVIARGTVFWSLGVLIRKVLSLFFPFSKFLSLDSFFRVRLSVMVRFRVSVRVRIRVKVRF